MQYCDLAINSVPIWTGVACMNLVNLVFAPYLAFVGELMFFDTQGLSDPVFSGLGTRYHLMYTQPGLDPVQVPLDAAPAQQFDVNLGGQNCTISLYER